MIIFFFYHKKESNGQIPGTAAFNFIAAAVNRSKASQESFPEAAAIATGIRIENSCFNIKRSILLRMYVRY
ncbi:MAG: hypothetical protein ACRYFV_20730 [Janthinobacterium lividum]